MDSQKHLTKNNEICAINSELPLLGMSLLHSVLHINAPYPSMLLIYAAYSFCMSMLHAHASSLHAGCCMNMLHDLVETFFFTLLSRSACKNWSTCLQKLAEMLVKLSRSACKSLRIIG
jgi:hypothetical protein